LEVFLVQESYHLLNCILQSAFFFTKLIIPTLFIGLEFFVTDGVFTHRHKSRWSCYQTTVCVCHRETAWKLRRWQHSLLTACQQCHITFTCQVNNPSSLIVLSRVI
jgi:hypothetical protein